MITNPVYVVEALPADLWCEGIQCLIDKVRRIVSKPVDLFFEFEISGLTPTIVITKASASSLESCMYASTSSWSEKILVIREVRSSVARVWLINRFQGGQLLQISEWLTNGRLGAEMNEKPTWPEEFLRLLRLLGASGASEPSSVALTSTNFL